ncbi:MAG: hypothetical protein HFG68_14420 [Hungatella sp.]|nr:hypothetical protein [Hungatella sp.]
MSEPIRTPAESLEDFLKFVDQCYQEHQIAQEAVSKEDKRLQDLLHELEFAQEKGERNRVATKFQRSRRERRKYKDIIKRNELVVKFFEEKPHRDTLNKLRQLLGRQRKEEEYLSSERIYKPRVN